MIIVGVVYIFRLECMLPLLIYEKDILEVILILEGDIIMKKVSFRIRKFDKEQFLTYNIDNDASLDEEVLDFLEEEEPKGLVPIIFEEDEEFDTFSYNVTDKIRLCELSNQEINAEMVLNVMRGLVLSLVDMGEYRVPLTYLVLHRNYIYINSDYEVEFICVPLEDMQDEVDVNAFLRSFVASLRFDTSENGDYVARMLSYINNTAIFNLRNMVTLVEDLMETMGIEIPEDLANEIYVDYEEMEDEDEDIIEDSEEVIQEDVAVTVEELDEDVVEDTEEAAEEPVEEAVKDTEEVAEEPAEEAVEDTEEVAEEPAEEVVEDTEEAAEESTEEAVEDTEEAAEESAEEAVEDTEEAAEESAEEAVEDIEEAVEVSEERAAETTQADVATDEVAETEETIDVTTVSQTEELAENKVSDNETDIDEDAQSIIDSLKKKVEQEQHSTVLEEVQKVVMKPTFKTKDTSSSGVVIEDDFDDFVAKMERAEKAAKHEEIGLKIKKSIKVNRASVAKSNRDEKKVEVAVDNNVEEEVANNVIQSQTVAATAVVKTTDIPKASPYLIRVNTEERIMITKQNFKVGKANMGVDYTVKGNSAVSRVHAIIVSKDDTYYVKDNKSTNHTFVNGKILHEGENELLTHDCKIVLGDEEFVFKLR